MCWKVAGITSYRPVRFIQKVLLRLTIGAGLKFTGAVTRKKDSYMLSGVWEDGVDTDHFALLLEEQSDSHVSGFWVGKVFAPL